MPTAQRGSPQGWGREAGICCLLPIPHKFAAWREAVSPLPWDMVLPVPGQVATNEEAPHKLLLTPGMSPELPLLLSLDLPSCSLVWIYFSVMSCEY